MPSSQILKNTIHLFENKLKNHDLRRINLGDHKILDGCMAEFRFRLLEHRPEVQHELSNRFESTLPLLILPRNQAREKLDATNLFENNFEKHDVCAISTRAGARHACLACVACSYACTV